jgi:cystinosin
MIPPMIVTAADHACTQTAWMDIVCPKVMARLLFDAHTYSTLAWSASFYPQPYFNWQRRSTRGLAVDFPLLNVLGFACYTSSTAVFLYSPTIRAQYAQRHPLSPIPTVQFNDLVFGAHAVVLVILTYSQFYSSLWGFDLSLHQHASRPVLGIVTGSLIAVLVVLGLVVASNDSVPKASSVWEWLDVLYTLGYIKLLATFVKYIPQAWLNYKRQSTEGWSIGQILCDITGGVLSILQLVIDASFQGDWGGISGNPLKFGLGCVSIVFDVIFITQHYALYRSSPALEAKRSDYDSDEPLLSERGD